MHPEKCQVCNMLIDINISSSGCSGTRNLNDNLSDLRAQVAANQKVHFMITSYHLINQGIALVCELIDSYGLDVVQAYMGHIQSNAEVAVRSMLKEVFWIYFLDNLSILVCKNCKKRLW